MERFTDFKKAPKITNKIQRDINRKYFMTFVFYESVDSRTRKCTCTQCGETFETKEYCYDKHNDNVKCVKCGQAAMLKNIGKSKSRKNLYARENVIIIMPTKDPNRVYLRCVTAYKDYEDSLTPPLWIAEKMRVLLTPGKAYQWKTSYYYTNYWRRNDALNTYGTNDFHLRNTGNPPLEPFPLVYNIGGTYTGGAYKHNIMGLENTFLKYSQRRLFNEHCSEDHFVKFLCCFALYPQIEMMLKFGLYGYVEELVTRNVKTARLINWAGKTPQEIFKVSKAEFKQWMTADYGDVKQDELFEAKHAAIYLYRVFKTKKKPQSMKDCTILATALKNQHRVDEFNETVEGLDIGISRFVRYFEKQNSINPALPNFTLWKDYTLAAKKLNYNLADVTVQFPKDILLAHDKATEAVETIETAGLRKSFKSFMAFREKQYAFELGNYRIVQPKTMKQITAEGSALHHCVSTYAKRHAKGKLTILFMRDIRKPNTPLYTIEMWDKHMNQVQGRFHCPVAKGEPKEFFDTWLNWVKRGSKKSEYEKLKKQYQPQEAKSA